MLFMHPCTMRDKAKLREFVTVVEVKRHFDKRVVNHPEMWDRWFKGMPLPNLLNDGRPFSADFMVISTVRSASLLRGSRIASLSLEGRLIFQQRIIKHFTRLEVDIKEIEAQSRPLELELELQAEWVQRHCDHLGESHETIEEAEVSFDAFMNSPEEIPAFTRGENLPLQTTRRGLLKYEEEFAGVNTDMQEMLSTITAKN